MGVRQESPLNAGAAVIVAVDEPELCSHLRSSFEAAGHGVVEAHDADSLETLLATPVPTNVLILDWQLPWTTGTALLQRIRTGPTTRSMPVIVLSSDAGEAESLAAFESGADDFITKPLSVRELVARVDAVLRRAANQERARSVRVGDIELDRNLVAVRRRGRALQLGPTGFRLLGFFLEAPGCIHSRDAIRDAIWGEETGIDARTVDVHVGRLRKSLIAGWRTDPIKTVRGVGYRFDPK